MYMDKAGDSTSFLGSDRSSAGGRSQRNWPSGSQNSARDKGLLSPCDANAMDFLQASDASLSIGAVLGPALLHRRPITIASPSFYPRFRALVHALHQLALQGQTWPSTV
jgi:hypothetical protein